MAPHLVCFDTTSIDVDGAGGHTIGRHGHSKNHRPDRPQMVVGVVLDADGQPVCRERWPGHTTDVNEEHARQDRHDREAIVAAWREAWPHGDNALVGNQGSRRFLKTPSARFTLDDTTVEEDTRDDGVWVLRTDTALEPLVVALALRHELEPRLAATRWSLEWADIVHDLDGLHETTITIDGHASIVRSDTKGTVGKILQACGVAIPPALRPAEAPGLPAGLGGGRVTTRNPRL
jgi:hypothetical protein